MVLRMDKRICQLVTLMFTVTLQICAVFIEVPLPLNVTSEQSALFRCTHATADTLAWRVNNTSVRNLPDSVVHEALAVLNGTLTSNLTIETNLKYNDTQVDCVALFFDPTTATELSPTVTLRIQGPLQKVTSLEIDINSNVLKLSWDAPFSLDLTNVDPDIIYYVKVINTTCGNGSIAFRNGVITETELNLFGYSQHHTYEVIVTPRSNVEGAKNGTTLITQVEFVKYCVTHLNVCFEDVLFRAHVQLTMIEIIGGLFTAKPASYSVLLVPNDGINEGTAIHRATIDEMDRNSVDLSLQPLPLRRRWNYTVIAYDCNQHPLTSTAELNTHDIQDIQIYSPSSGQVRVSGVFVQGATAMGILVIIYPLDHVNLNMYYFEAFKAMITNVITTTITGLSAGQYGISVFILEDGGLPFNRSATAPKRLFVQNGKDMAEPETTIEYKVTQASTNGHGVCVECTFLDKSAEYCVVIVHEKVLCFGLSHCEINLTNIITSFKIARSGDKGYKCVQNVNVTNYQVGVIGGRQIPYLVTNTDSACSTCSNDLSLNVLGVFIGVLILGGMITTLLMIFIYRYSKKSRSRSMRYGIPVTENQESESRYEELPSRSDRGFEDSTRTTQTDINSELPTYDQVAAQSDFPDAYQAETRESPFVYQASTNVHTDSQTTTPFTIENLVKYLLPVADKWKDIGEVLSVTENILDEIFTKCNSPQECLREMLKYYLMRSDLVHDWVEIANALRKVGEETLSNEISQGRLNRGPTEAVPTMEESVGDRESHDELAIAIPHVTPNQATEDYPTSDSGVTLLVGLSASMFRAQKTEAEQVHAVSSSDQDDLELAYPIPETEQETDPSRSQCIHLQHDDQREMDRESISESDTSRDSSSCIHIAGLNEDYSNVHRHRHFSSNSTQLQRPTHEYVIPSHHSDGEECSSLCHVHPDGAQAIQLGRAESDDQLSTCTIEPHNNYGEDLQAEHCAPEPSSMV